VARQYLTEGDHENAAEAFAFLVAAGQALDEVIGELENFVAANPGAVSLWQVLGDGYMKTDQLQKALDAYRQALGRL